MVRVEPAQTDELLREPHASPMVRRGREIDGWLRVAASGVEDNESLGQWVERGVSYVESLPPK